jgi:hypothetical protein
MKKTPIAWAIQRPDKSIVTAIIRSTRREAIQSICSHIRQSESADPWRMLVGRGFRVVQVEVALMQLAAPNRKRLAT